MKLLQLINPDLIFRAFKYTVYALLTFNIFLFYQEESLATQQTFSQGMSLANIIEGFAATIDTVAWVVLLLMFEFETYVLSQQTLQKPRVKVSFALLRTLSYGFILYAFYGYVSKILFTYDISPFVVEDICQLVGQGFYSVFTLDEYPPLDIQSCGLLQGQELLKLNNQQIIGSSGEWQSIQRLAWVDAINSITWIIVVLVLEVDVWLQLRERFYGAYRLFSKILKGLLYSVLFAAATYWGILGDFLDFWDAFMWLVAFVFIELNIFQWQQGSRQTQ